MIHWNRDRNESTWVNEGFSELAVLLNGYEVGSEYSYIVNPDLQLNDWPNDSSQTSPHYGAAFLFFTYFLDRFGEQIQKKLFLNRRMAWKELMQFLRITIFATLSLARKSMQMMYFNDWGDRFLSKR